MSNFEAETHSHHSDSSFDEADDQDWADWVDDDDAAVGGMQYAGSSNASNQSFKLPTHALFPDRAGKFGAFETPMQALEDARKQHGCDLNAVIKRCGK